MKTLFEYIKLTKPTIMLLVLLTGATALVMEGRFLSQPIDFILVLFGLFLTGGAANALNQFFERDIDAQMGRTSSRRPLPQGKFPASRALIFAVTIGFSGVMLFGLRYNWLSALLALGTILFYSLFYTLWLKPNTHQNIVIGGAAGSMAPLIAWAAATGGLTLTPWILFLIIFFWTPPHFWALALCVKEDYKRVGLPMLPVVKGDDATLKQIFYYTLVLVVISLALLATSVGWLYIVAAALLGGMFIKKSHETRRAPSISKERGLFGYSIVYLLALFSAIIIDALIG